MENFSRHVADYQTKWRKSKQINQVHGYQNGNSYPWILPRGCWEQGLWKGINGASSNSLPNYLYANEVKRHDGCHNLKSSWMLCANLYFPFRQDTALLAGFLKANVLDSIVAVDSIELEYAEKCPFDPSTLLGEPHGQRGQNQTSPDIAFKVTLNNGSEGLILTENKYTEHSFYACSGRDKKYGNRDINRCMDFDNLLPNLSTLCYQLSWADGDRTNRKYWEYLQLTEKACTNLKRCPAATAGYQLFRQQALAEAFARSGKYSSVISCVAYDDRNDTLKACLKSTGVNDFTKDWAPLFKGKSQFTTFQHQQWVNWVRTNGDKNKWKDWLEYVEERYELQSIT